MTYITGGKTLLTQHITSKVNKPNTKQNRFLKIKNKIH